MIQLSIDIIGYSAVVGVDSTHFEEAANRNGAPEQTVIPCHSWILMDSLPISWLQRGSGKRILQRPRGPHCRTACFGFASPLRAGQSRHDSVERWSLKNRKDWYKKHQQTDKCSNTNFKPSTIH